MGLKTRELTWGRRTQIVLVDDPNFVPDLILPPLDFDENGDLVLPGFEFSQRSKVLSQFSPLDHGSNSPANAPFINLNIRHSSSQGSVNLASPFDNGRQSQKDDSMFPGAFGEEEELPFADFPIRIDADGNLIEEPELPLHPSQQIDFAEPATKDQSGVHFPDDEGMIVHGDEDALKIFGDDEGQLPVVDAAQHSIEQNDDVPFPSEEPVSPEPAEEQVQHQRKQRKQRKAKSLAPDVATHISRAEFKNWTDNYRARTQEAQDGPRQVAAAQAKKNAYNLVFGKGLGDVGILNGIPGLDHELAHFFAGENLKDIVMGDILAGVEEEVEEENARGGRRRRSASVAFGSENEAGEDGRRVRPRADEGEQEQQVDRSQQDAQVVDDSAMMFGDDQDLLPEVGREHPGSALSDHRRSSNAPWNRPSSVVPSSARSGKHIEAGRNAVEQSPLVGRGSILQQSEAKFSDDGVPVLGSDGFAPFGNDGAHDPSSFGDFGVEAGVSMQEVSTSQFMREALDREGRNFLGFVERVAADHGEEDAREESLRWVDFSGLFEPQDNTRAVVAHAFLHVLTLATKNQIKVRQDGVEQKEPFGEIRVGVKSAIQDDHDDFDEDVGEGQEMGIVEEEDQDVEE